MEEKEKRNKKTFSSAGKTIIAASLSVTFLILVINIGVFTYAKYHSEDSGKGVATVSADFFFMSNYLSGVDSIQWTDDITESEAVDAEHNFDYVYGESDWTATTPCMFNLEIYNFENTLRYNAETVKYTLYAKMLGTPLNSNDKYELIVYNDDRTEELERYILNDSGIVSVEGCTLIGDTSSKNSFGLLVNPDNPDDYVPVNIIIYAEITSPDYIDPSIYYLGAIFSPQAEKQTFSVSGSFDVEAEIQGGSDWIESLNDLSGYIYTAVTEGEADAEHDIILYWNSECLSFDLHNGFYTEQTNLKSDGSYKDRTPIEYDNFVETGKVEDLSEDKQETGYTDYLIYHSPANRSESFIFYKTENWNTEQETNEDGENIMKPSNYDEFTKFVKVALY